MSILNSGFEEKFEESFPKYWKRYSTGTTQKYTYPEQGRSGGYSVAIEYKTRESGKTAMWFQDIEIDNTRKYKLSGWVKTENIIGEGSSIRVDWKDSTGKYIGGSMIMTYQQGTAPWKYFEGEITPRQNAVKATIVLDLHDCSGKVWFDDISIVSISISDHPNIFINQEDISVIKARKNKEPWKTQYNKVISDADSALSLPIQSITFKGKTPPSGDIHDYFTESPYCGWTGLCPNGSQPVGPNRCCDGYHNPNADRTDYNSAMKMKVVRELGFAYAFTGDSKYANKAIQLINGWCVTPATRMNPKWTGNFIEFLITFGATLYGAGLIWNYSNWNSTDKTAFETWIQQLIYNIKSNESNENWDYWRLLFMAEGAILINDNTILQYVFNRFKYHIGVGMDTQGRIIKEYKRTKGLFYSLYGVQSLLQIAEIARHHGVDLYNYKTSDGRGLELALDYHAQYVKIGNAPKPWPYQEIAPNLVDYSVYELAYSFEQKSNYRDAVRRIGRPITDKRIMGPITLTHSKII